MNLNWSEPTSWIIGGLLLILLGIQVGLLLRNTTLTTGRKLVRLSLNVLLWLIVAGYIWQPRWRVTVDSKQAIVAAGNVPRDYINRLKDSLKIAESFHADDFKGQFETVTLVGQQVPASLLSQLSATFVQWIPYFQPDAIQALQWKEIVRRGELQQVTGRLQAAEKGWLKLLFGAQVLDSVAVTAGTNAFRLRFPAFAAGRSEAVLVLNGEALDTLRYFTRPAKKLTYQFVLGSPDFETKTLADWLGQQGNSVLLTSTVSKDLQTSVAINKKSGTVPDIIITDADNGQNAVVKKAVSQGKPVLFLNLANPDTDIRAINQATGSNWALRRISNEDHVVVASGLNALPFSFADALHQQPVTGVPVAVQYGQTNVAVSLLAETFPLKLSGDSLAYSKLWTAILAPLQPADKNSILVDGPVISGLGNRIQLNNWTVKPAALRVGGDTARVRYSPINPLSGEASYVFSKAGWTSVQDSVDVYVEGKGAWQQTQQVQAYALAQTANQLTTAVGDHTHWREVRVPTWVWLVLFLGCLTALWLEPKLG
nr:hypothetical protein [uncultured Arsenicibacter sp.]